MILSQGSQDSNLPAHCSPKRSRPTWRGCGLATTRQNRFRVRMKLLEIFLVLIRAILIPRGKTHLSPLSLLDCIAPIPCATSSPYLSDSSRFPFSRLLLSPMVPRIALRSPESVFRATLVLGSGLFPPRYL